MKELTEKKKLEILRLFLEGYSYDQISTEAAVGKGTVVNVVNDFRAGCFPAFSDIADLVDGLRQLSVELKKRGAGVSEALLGLAFFFRLSEIGVTPDKLWLWAQMCRELSPAEAPVQEFITAALELFKLAQETGDSYGSIGGRCSELRAESERLEQEVGRLESTKKEVESASTTLTGKCQALAEQKRTLGAAAAEFSSKCEAVKKKCVEYETKRQALKTEVEQLEAKSAMLGPVVERLENLDFSKTELQVLNQKLQGIAASQGLTAEALREKFFAELSAYGATLGFEKRKEELQAQVSRMETKMESFEKVITRLGLPLDEIEKALRGLASLKRKGINPSMVVSYYQVLSQTEMETSELEHEVIELGGLKKAIDTATQAVKQLEAEAAQRTRVVEALRAEEATIKATIKELTRWGQKVIKEAQDKALTTVKRATEKMAKDLRQWGDARAELGEYLEDLKRARYFTRLPLSNEALDSYVQDVSPLVVSQGLQMVLF